ncbi:hypothetical protein LTR17_019479 [Elasticomyces elasticus]|nr:hypothetical protein LTR17_019479 [Elasticomyces elasticus]
MQNIDDRRTSINQILETRRSRLVEELQAIQLHTENVDKAHAWAENLLCLQYDQMLGPNLKAVRNHGLEREYVAVSWTWQHSVYEDPRSGMFRIIRGECRKLSEIRNCVLERVVKYLSHHQISLFWIDQECIDQKDARKKVQAINSMDLVYKNATKSLALTSTPIMTSDGLCLIQILMDGGLAFEDGPGVYVMRPGISITSGLEVVTLLTSLAGDIWWSRAWTFQEEYTANGPIPGELCINAANFRKESTIFLLAFLKRDVQGRYKTVCDNILRRFGRYNVILRQDRRGLEPMSARIFADVSQRSISHPWDTLAITANACGYSARLDTESLSRQGYSLSLSLLAQFLLNGEIIFFDPCHSSAMAQSLLTLDVSSFLRGIQLAYYDLPVYSRQMTFLKDCRLPSVRFCQQGLRTRGFLWSLQPEHKIHTSAFKLPAMPPAREACLVDHPWEALELKYLVGSLEMEHPSLAERLGTWIDGERQELSSKAKIHVDRMAWSLVQAVMQGYILRIGYLVQGDGVGIFIPSWDAKYEPMHVFTTWQPSYAGIGGLDNFVSLEVEILRNGTVRTVGWINGLVFYHGQHPRPVIFAWPCLWI